MPYSRPTANKNEPNCELSDISQNDLQPEVDYAHEPTSFLFAWDNNNPQCMPKDRGDTWSVYTVNGYPCRRGTVCQENREAGFWSCELEGGEVGSWDYCCRPDHKCGYSNGYSYPWCYVGPAREQWRKCSDKYFPYNNQMISDKIDKPFVYIAIGNDSPHRPPSITLASDRPSASWHKEKPFRPPYYHSRPESPHDRPTFGNYEIAFNQQFLDPPKPGGLNKGRHWPVSYLHKEGPPNATSDAPEENKNRKIDNINKYQAISTLMKNINEDKSKLDYTTVLSTSKQPEEEIFLVRIPMPEKNNTDKILKFDVVDTKNSTKSRSPDFEELFVITVPKSTTEGPKVIGRSPKRDLKIFPIVRRGYVTRTNLTSIRKRRTKPEDDPKT